MASALTLVKARASGLSKKLASTQSVPAAIGSAAIVDGAAFAAGFADDRLPEVAGLRPSVAAGIASAAIGIATKSSRAVQVASGLLAPFAYEAGKQASQSMKTEPVK
jgi:hypothetical protein